MSESLSPRIDVNFRQAIDEIAQGERQIGETAAKLIHIGIAVREVGAEPEITGPFGLPRPFAKISLSDMKTEIALELDDDLYERLINEFNSKKNTAAREALRLGVFTVADDQFEITGPAGGPRPFAGIEIDKIDNREVRDLISEFREQV